MSLRILIALSFILIALRGWADVDIDTQDIGIEPIKEVAKRTPFSYNTHLDVISSAEIENGFFKGDKVHFAEAEADVGMVFYYCPAYTEGARIALGYKATYLRWSENPWFDQDHFNTVALTFAGFSQRFDRWFWRSQFTINFDADDWEASYTSYDIILWGRYTYNDNIGVHLGFLAQTGLRLDRVYPIFGFDWQISRDWKLHLIYPVDMYLAYSLTHNWSILLAGRTFNSRFRVNKHEIFSQALVRYTNFGAEIAIKYETKTMTANVHVGTTMGGKYREANRHNHHAHNYKLDSSAYVGAEMDVSF